jgi:hypothetical protein
VVPNTCSQAAFHPLLANLTEVFADVGHPARLLVTRLRGGSSGRRRRCCFGGACSTGPS